MVKMDGYNIVFKCSGTDTLLALGSAIDVGEKFPILKVVPIRTPNTFGHEDRKFRKEWQIDRNGVLGFSCQKRLCFINANNYKFVGIGTRLVVMLLW